MENKDSADDELVERSYGQALPPSPTPTPTPFFKEPGTAASVVYSSLTSHKRSEEQKAVLISHMLYSQEQQLYKLEQQSALDAQETRAHINIIGELKEKVARLEGTIDLLNEKADGTEKRLKEVANREKVAILLAGLLIPLGIGVLDKSGVTAATLLILGTICAAAGISPKVMGLFFKDKKK